MLQDSHLQCIADLQGSGSFWNKGPSITAHTVHFCATDPSLGLGGLLSMRLGACAFQEL